MSEPITRFLVADDKIAIQRVQDCTGIMESAKRLQAEGAHGSSELRHVARVPAVIVERYCNDNKITFGEFLRDQKHHARLLNDPDLAYFRVSPEKV